MATVIDGIRNYFLAHTDLEYEIYFSKYPRYAIGLIRKIFAGLDKDITGRVYAVGGDGILFDCLNGIMGFPNAELGSIPYGACNDFIRSFGVNAHRFFKNIELQATASTLRTDVIYCGNSYALNCCCLGISSRSQQLETMYAKKCGRFYRNAVNSLYTIGGIRAVFEKGISRQRYELLIDGARLEDDFCDILIANGPCYGKDRMPMPVAVPDDGELDVLLAKSGSQFTTLRMMSTYLHGNYYRYPQYFSHRKAKNIVINSARPLAIILDGEFFIDTHLSLSLIPGAIEFVNVNGITYGNRDEET
jgi:diacylglycerol kinase family enzyme